MCDAAGAAAGSPVTALEVGGEEARRVDAARERAGKVPALVPRAEVVHRIRGCRPARSSRDWQRRYESRLMCGR